MPNSLGFFSLELVPLLPLLEQNKLIKLNKNKLIKFNLIN